MTYCKYCGVELDENMESCPLCNTPILAVYKDAEEGQQRPSYIPQKDLSIATGKLTKKQKSRLFWELSAIILLSAIIVTLIIDIIISKGITWSRYTVTLCLVIFVIISLFSFWRNRPILFLGGSFLSLALLLVLFDSYMFNIGWGNRVGVPILVILYVNILILFLLIRITKQRGLNIIAYFFIVAGLISFSIESILDKYFLGHFDYRWSLIVIVSALPIAGILFFIHYRMRVGTELRRLFHI